MHALGPAATTLGNLAHTGEETEKRSPILEPGDNRGSHWLHVQPQGHLFASFVSGYTSLAGISCSSSRGVTRAGCRRGARRDLKPFGEV